MPITPKKYADAAAAESARMTELLEAHQERLERSIRRLEQRIQRSLNQLQIGLDGRIEGTPTMTFMQEYRRQLVKEFDELYGTTAQEVTQEFRQHLDEYESFIKEVDVPARFTKRDRNVFEMSRSYTLNDLEQVGDKARQDIEAAVLDGILTGASFDEVEQQIRDILAGTEEDAGRLLSQAGRIAHDGEMQFYARMNVTAAQRGGMSRFLYAGTIVGSSRAFCIARAGRVFTREEIDAWNSHNWRGKACDVWVCRGGYNCRHQLLPVPDDIGAVEVPSWFDDAPMSPKLADEVAKEQRAIDRLSAGVAA